MKEYDVIVIGAGLRISTAAADLIIEYDIMRGKEIRALHRALKIILIGY